MYFADDEFLLLSRSGRTRPARPQAVSADRAQYEYRAPPSAPAQNSTPRAPSQSRTTSGGSADHSARAARRRSVASSSSTASRR